MSGVELTLEGLDSLDQYCSEDVITLQNLFQALVGRIDWPRALLRGRYVRALAQVEARGIPIDEPSLAQFQQEWAEIRGKLIEGLDAPFAIYEGGSFRQERFEHWLRRQGHRLAQEPRRQTDAGRRHLRGNGIAP